MDIQAIVLLVTQVVSLTSQLVSGIQKVSALSESDRAALRNSVREMKDKIAAITWEEP